MRRPSNCLLLSLLALIVSVIFFEVTDIDLLVQGAFYDGTAHRWVVDRTDPLLRWIFYDGIKGALLILVVAALWVSIFFARWPSVAGYRRAIWLTLTSMLLIVACNSGLKAVTNVACPAQLTAFGGSIPYIRLLDSYPAGQRPAKAQRCFPAGHAGGGFALLSWVLLFKTPRNRRMAIAGAMALGWVMGFYKMLIGDHFLSHTIASMLLAWCIVCAIAWISGRGRGDPPMTAPARPDIRAAAGPGGR